jgi:transglutaminase superfamily protein
MPVLRKLRTIWSLGSGGRELLLEAAVLPVLIGASFRLADVARTQAWLRRWTRFGRKRSSVLDAQATIRSARWSQRMVRSLTGLGGTCLVRSFTLWTLLLRRGVNADIRIGLRKSEDTFEGHAWLERAGLPINEDAAVVATYSPYHEAFAFDAMRYKERHTIAPNGPHR